MTQLQINGWFIFITLGFVLLWKLDFFTTLLNLKAFQSAVPLELVDVVDSETFEKSREYNRLRSIFGIGSSAFSLVLFLGFWWLGGFGWLDNFVRSFGFGSITTGVIYIGLLVLALQIVALPFSWYSMFKIEAEFGFNKITFGLFVADFLRGLLLLTVIGTPVLVAVLWIFEKVPLAWFWGWVFMTLVMLIGVFLAPTLIFPLYNRFRPLEEGALKTGINEMAERCQFPVKEVSIMDGSKRSTKSNAFFTGFGPTKRIVLFDTLVKNHTVPELVAVLAHEIGHYKKRHVIKGLVLGIVGTGVMFFLLGQLVNHNRPLLDAFGVEKSSIYISLVLFGILMQPVSQILGIGGNWLSRKHEFEADAFAAEVMGSSEPMVTVLKKLSVDNLSNLTPHPVYVFLNYSHPPVVERISALRR